MPKFYDTKFQKREGLLEGWWLMEEVDFLEAYYIYNKHNIVNRMARSIYYSLF